MTGEVILQNAKDKSSGDKYIKERVCVRVCVCMCVYYEESECL